MDGSWSGGLSSSLGWSSSSGAPAHQWGGGGGMLSSDGGDGATIGRLSVVSWAHEDAYDREAARTVRAMLDDIEHALFCDSSKGRHCSRPGPGSVAMAAAAEAVQSVKMAEEEAVLALHLPAAMLAECACWRRRFPYLRVQGATMLRSRESGVQVSACPTLKFILACRLPTHNMA